LIPQGLNIIKETFLPQEERLCHKADIPCSPNTENKEKPFTVVMNVKKNCAWVSDSRAIAT
jgi:hypothetical protein